LTKRSDQSTARLEGTARRPAAGRRARGGIKISRTPPADLRHRSAISGTSQADLEHRSANIRTFPGQCQAPLRDIRNFPGRHPSSPSDVRNIPGRSRCSLGRCSQDLATPRSALSQYSQHRGAASTPARAALPSPLSRGARKKLPAVAPPGRCAAYAAYSPAQPRRCFTDTKQLAKRQGRGWVHGNNEEHDCNINS